MVDIGIHWPDSASASVIGGDGVAGQLTLNELRSRSAGLVRLNTSDPLLSAQFKSQVGDSNLLANPRVRVRNRQSAKILIGERVPVITTTATANVGTSQSINYLDVGLKLDIEPTVSLDDDVSMKIALEVSNILETITLTGGSRAYRLGTRNTSTNLRVRDGETNILAGLIQRDERHSNTGIPGLNEVPIANRLFGAAEDNDTRTEIVLLITPRIVRNLDVPGIGQQEFLSGTEASTGAAPIQLGNSAAHPGNGAAPCQRVAAGGGRSASRTCGAAAWAGRDASDRDSCPGARQFLSAVAIDADGGAAVVHPPAHRAQHAREFAVMPTRSRLVPRRSCCRGFTLVEMLVVIAIVAVLSSIGLPLATLAHQRVQEEELRRSLREIRSAIDAYKRLVDQGSIQRAADASGYPPSLAVLSAGVADAKSPVGTRIYVLRRLPRDPFAPTDVPPEASWALRSYASSPADPQPGKDVFDVHSR